MRQALEKEKIMDLVYMRQDHEQKAIECQKMVNQQKLLKQSHLNQATRLWKKIEEEIMRREI